MSHAFAATAVSDAFAAAAMSDAFAAAPQDERGWLSIPQSIGVVQRHMMQMVAVNGICGRASVAIRRACGSASVVIDRCCSLEIIRS
jgi:hypothetical protein